jgi:hypothetical protein
MFSLDFLVDLDQYKEMESKDGKTDLGDKKWVSQPFNFEDETVFR